MVLGKVIMKSRYRYDSAKVMATEIKMICQCLAAYRYL